MKTWTIGEILAGKPCAEYDRVRLEKLWAGRERVSLAEVLRMDIPASDRIWVACRPGALTDDQRTAWLEIVVTRAVTNHALNCGVTDVESWARKWLSGEDRSAASAAAARDAARAAGTALAAQAAARAAVWAVWAAGDAVWAVWAAGDAASATEGTAAFAAERNKQLADLKAVLAESDDAKKEVEQ